MYTIYQTQLKPSYTEKIKDKLAKNRLKKRLEYLFSKLYSR